MCNIRIIIYKYYLFIYLLIFPFGNLWKTLIDLDYIFEFQICETGYGKVLSVINC